MCNLMKLRTFLSMLVKAQLWSNSHHYYILTLSAVTLKKKNALLSRSWSTDLIHV